MPHPLPLPVGREYGAGPSRCFVSFSERRCSILTKWDPIPINVEPFDINGVTPMEAEIQVAVKGLKYGQAGEVSGVKAKRIKQWTGNAI